MQADELLQAAIDAWNRDDLGAVLETLHPDIVYHTAGVFMGLRPSYSGHDGIRQFWRDIHEPWETLHLEVDRLDRVGSDGYVLNFRFRARGRESGASVDLRFSHAGRIRDGLIIEMFAAPTYEAALERLEGEAG